MGDTPGVARIVAGVLETPFQPPPFPQLDTAIAGDALEIPIGPTDIAANEDGSFWFADRLRRRVAFVTADGQVTTPLGSGDCGIARPGPGPGAEVCFQRPTAVALGPEGRVYVADERGQYVFGYDPAADTAFVVLGVGTAGVGTEGAIGRQTRTAGPADVAVGVDGSIFVAERLNHRIVRVTPEGRLRVAAGTGDQGDAGDDGPAADALLSLPEGVHLMGDTLYIADSGNHRLRRVIEGVISGYAGVGAPGFRGDGGPVGAALFDRPGRMASSGSLLFVTDRSNHRIRLIRVGPDSIRTFGGTGEPRPGSDLLEIGRTALATPVGIAAGGRAVFVADSGGFVVRRVVR